MSYEEAVQEYENRANTRLGKLIANRELPILHRAKEIIDTEFIRATAKDLEDYMKAKIDAFSDDLQMYGFGPTDYDDYDKELKNIEQYPTYKVPVHFWLVYGCIFLKT